MSEDKERVVECDENGESDVVWTRDRALEICRDFLGGAWRDISSSDMIFRTVTGGLTNALYYCSLPEDCIPVSSEPKEALLRIYAGIYNSVVTESVVITMLSERKLGPKLYGVFSDGRLEEYIPASSLTCDQLRDPDISTGIARKLAQVHKLHMPVDKKPTWIFDKLRSWYDSLQSSDFLDFFCCLPTEKKILAEKILSHDLEREIDWLESFLTKIDSPVVFSHNDLQEGNILLPNGPQKVEDRLVFIDFEYCSYNYRGFDFGNHFCEWRYDYTSPVYPHYETLEQEYPRKEEQLRFIRAYLSAFTGNENCEETADMEEQLLWESEAFILASHLLWVIWSVSQGCTSKITFGFLEYGLDRLDAYFRCKDSILSKTKENKKAEIE